jgi:hypothetical protein
MRLAVSEAAALAQPAHRGKKANCMPLCSREPPWRSFFRVHNGARPLGKPGTRDGPRALSVSVSRVRLGQDRLRGGRASEALLRGEWHPSPPIVLCQPTTGHFVIAPSFVPLWQCPWGTRVPRTPPVRRETLWTRTPVLACPLAGSGVPLSSAFEKGCCEAPSNIFCVWSHTGREATGNSVARCEPGELRALGMTAWKPWLPLPMRECPSSRGIAFQPNPGRASHLCAGMLRPKTSRLATHSTLIDGLSFCV